MTSKLFNLIHTARKAAVMLLCVLAFAACGSDGGDDNGGGGSSSQSKNQNQNPASGYDTNKSGLNATQRMEFPSISTPSGNYYIIVHTLSNSANTTTVNGKSMLFDKDGVNFCTIWDKDKKSQLCSCYQMHRGFGGSYSRVAGLTYPQDPDLPAQYRLDTDYISKSGFQHGHVLKQTERSFSHDANYMTNYMTNMQPQYGQFNAFDEKDKTHTGLWLKMENFIDGLSNKLGTDDTLFICKGGTIQDGQVLMKIKDKMIVPKYFFMAVLKKSANGTYHAFGFWTEHLNTWVPSTYNLKQNAMSIDELEKKTGMDFFCNLPDDVEKSVEASFNPYYFGF